MAGLGYKDFTAGAVLTAAQVDGYLMEQSVMNFAGTAARGSALASVQAAGMVAHVGGGTLTVATSGSAWAEIYPGTSAGLVKITDASFSAGTAVSVNNCFTSTYRNYLVLINHTNSANTDLNCRLRVSSSDASGSNYFSQRLSVISTTVTGNLSAPATSARVGNADGNIGQNAVEILILNPSEAVTTVFIGRSFANSALPGSNAEMQHHFSTQNLSTAYDGLTIFPTTGNITGTIRIYGYRN
jgi:hypothetical protein